MLTCLTYQINAAGRADENNTFCDVLYCIKQSHISRTVAINEDLLQRSNLTQTSSCSSFSLEDGNQESAPVENWFQLAQSNDKTMMSCSWEKRAVQMKSKELRGQSWRSWTVSKEKCGWISNKRVMLTAHRVPSVALWFQHAGRFYNVRHTAAFSGVASKWNVSVKDCRWTQLHHWPK